MKYNNVDLFLKIDSLIESNLNENERVELLEKIKFNIFKLEVTDNYFDESEARMKQIIINHLEAYVKNGNIKEIEKAKFIITDISKY